MSHPVLVGVDGSEAAASAALTAAELASALGVGLGIVCAYEKFEVERVTSGSDEYVFSTADDAATVADNAASVVRASFPGLDVATRAVQGKPANALIEAAESTSARLIVVGNKRVQGMARVLGSIATDVAHRASCDVYIAHTHPRD